MSSAPSIADVPGYPDIIARVKRNRLIADAVREWRRAAKALVAAEDAYLTSWPRTDEARARVEAAEIAEVDALGALALVADAEDGS